MLAHGTGLGPGQLSLSFQLIRIRGAWYVTNISLNA
jgi:hypothetical protein